MFVGRLHNFLKIESIPYLKVRYKRAKYLDIQELDVQNSLFLLNSRATSATTDSRDLGFVGKVGSGTALTYTGLFRDTTDATYKLFQGLQTAPNVNAGTIANATDAGFAYANLNLQNFHAFGNTILDGSLTVNGSVTTFNVSTLTVQDNIIVANAGPSAMKPDGGFVIRRTTTGIAGDTAKESGTASATGSTTTVTLQANNGHGTVADYYKGWTVTVAGDATGTSVVTGSSASTPTTLTLATAVSKATSITTTYALFNKTFTGTIYNESGKTLQAIGFPREDLISSLSPTVIDGSGNLVDYVNYKVQDLVAAGDIYLAGTIKAAVKFDDNIIVTNFGPSNSGQDGGVVSKRSSANIVADDTPKIAAAVIQANYASGSATINIVNAASGINYFKGWTIRYNTDVTNPTSILSSSNVGTTHTLVLKTAFPVALTSATDTVDLFNKKLVGPIYHESTNTQLFVGFPREDGESVIDPVSPVNGNIPDFINVAAKDITSSGYLYLSSAVVSNTKTQIGAATFVISDMMLYDVIYLNPTANATYTLPAISTINLSANRSKRVMFVNLSTFTTTILGSSSDTFEGLSSMLLTRQFSKTVLFATTEFAGTWFIKA